MGKEKRKKEEKERGRGVRRENAKKVGTGKEKEAVMGGGKKVDKGKEKGEKEKKEKEVKKEEEKVEKNVGVEVAEEVKTELRKVNIPVTDVQRTPLEMLLREISSVEVISHKEQARLVKLAQQGDKDAFNKLIRSNLKFVVKIALEYKNWRIPVEDLIDEGIMGLVRAIQKFNPTQDVKLTSYASYWIRAYIQKYINENYSMVKLARTMDEKKALSKIFTLRGDEKERRKQIKKISKELGVSEDTIRMVENKIYSKDFSLDLSYDDDGSMRFSDVIASETDVLSEVERLSSLEFIRNKLRDALSKLTSTERQIIEQRYLTDSKKTLQQLADELKLTKEKIKAIEKKALLKLRDLFKIGNY